MRLRSKWIPLHVSVHTIEYIKPDYFSIFLKMYIESNKNEELVMNLTLKTKEGELPKKEL